MFTVSCPNCGATYQLDEAKVGPAGRKLKCAKCAHVWVAKKEPGSLEPGSQVEEVRAPDVGGTQGVEAAGAEVREPGAGGGMDVPSVDEHAPSDLPVEEQHVIPARPVEELAGVGRQGAWRWFMGPRKWIWLGTVVAAAGLSAGLWVLMAPVDKGEDVDMNAPVVGAPDVMKRDVVKAPDGVVVGDVSSGFSIGGRDEMVFAVSGTMANTGKVSVTVPNFQVELVGKDGAVADVWPAKLEKSRLAPGEVTEWEVSFTNPPVDDISGWRGNFVK